MKKIAITGGLSSGKSTVCRFLCDLGAYVVNADEIVHHLLLSDKCLRQKLVDLLGSDIIIENQINRRVVANKAFSHPKTLKTLESLIHPLVFHEIERQYQIIKNDPNYSLFVVEIPLLYETQYNEQNASDLFDAVVVVLSEEKLCKERFMRLRNQSEEEFTLRMFRQLSPEEKAAKAHFILLNNQDLPDLQKQVQHLLTKLRSI